MGEEEGAVKEYWKKEQAAVHFEDLPPAFVQRLRESLTFKEEFVMRKKN